MVVGSNGKELKTDIHLHSEEVLEMELKRRGVNYK